MKKRQPMMTIDSDKKNESIELSQERTLTEEETSFDYSDDLDINYAKQRFYRRWWNHILTFNINQEITIKQAR